MHPVHKLIAMAGSGADPADEIRNVTGTYSTTAVIFKNTPTPSVQLNFLADGNMTVTHAQGSGIGTPNADEWHRDNTAVVSGGGWSIRATLTAGDAFNIGNMVAGTWHAITTTRTIGESYASGGVPGDRTGTFTFDWSNDGGSTIIKTVTGMSLAAVAT